MRKRNRRPTGDQLSKMSDAELASFIRSSGLKTVTTAGLRPNEGNAKDDSPASAR